MDGDAELDTECTHLQIKKYRHPSGGLSSQGPDLDMPKQNADNERIRRTYFTHLKLACGLSEASIDAAAKAIHRFESSTGHGVSRGRRANRHRRRHEQDDPS